MSTRQLRKLQKQRELDQAREVNDREVEGSSGDEAPVAAKPRVSLFAALGGEEDHEDEDEDQGQDDQRQEEVTETQPATSTKKSKKKKKKKTKAKAVDEGASEEDEIDKAIKELKLSGHQLDITPDTAAQSSKESTRRINELLRINTDHLKVINEMRRVFGQDVIESANAEEEEEQRNRTRRGGPQQQVDLETFLRGPPGQKTLPEVSLRRNVFIQGREHWPRKTAGGLTMEQLNKDVSHTEYTYAHSAQYDDAQKAFFNFVGHGDPMRMVWLLQELPYHVSTLLQVSSVAKQDQNMALASELCERALFTFGRVATTAFRQDLEQGRARLDFRRPENRQFWLAGYHYLKSLVRKGTYKTALEWAKVLFALDHSDPYAMRHFIHFLAIRAYEAKWFIDFMDELEKMGDNRDTAYLRQTLVLAKLQLKDEEGARTELRAGIHRVPWLYCALFQELGLDTPPSIWGMHAESDNRSFWVKLYLHQTKDLWNNPQATSLLQEVAKGLSKVDTSSLPSDDAPPDLGTTRMVFLEGQTSLIAAAPREFLERQPNFEFDPLPPAEEDNIFNREGCRLPWTERTNGSRAVETQMEIQLRNLIDGRLAMAAAAGGGGAAVGAGALGGAFGGGDDSEDDMEALAMDDEDLRRDIEEHARQANAPGLIQTLMQMLRGGPGETNIPDDEIEDEEGLEQGEFPGAWPEDEDDFPRRTT